MTKILISPSKYVQGANAINELAKMLSIYGKKVLIVGGKTGVSTVKDNVEKTFAQAGLSYKIEIFGGECSKKEIDRISDIAKKESADILVGVGGGKALDAVKASAYYLKLPVAIVPTIAATDAPCSALSVIYTESGTFESYLVLPKNPDLVLLDTTIIANAPERLLISGMGDALATWFEADACARSNALNMSGGHSTQSALNLAKLCFDTLLEYGNLALFAVRNKVVTEALERVVEANTLLSGIGFESSGLAAAHAIHNGLTVLEETHSVYHGEKVAFGTITQLILENKSKEEIMEVLMFCMDIGLPVTLEQIGIKNITKEKIMKAAEAACAEGETIHNLPFKVNADMVYAAIMTANEIGKSLFDK